MKMTQRALMLMMTLAGITWFGSGPAAPRVRAEATTALELATLLEEAFTQVAEQAFPAVVVITNKRRNRQPLYPPSTLPPEFRHFFGRPQRPAPNGPHQHPERPQQREAPHEMGKGSGTIIRPDGYILTNYHVIKDNDALIVELQDGRTFDSARSEDAVKIVGVDEESDLAVLQIGNGELSGLPTMSFADSDKVKVGQWAIAVGAPLALDRTATYGHVSQIGRYGMMPTGPQKIQNFIQTDTAINPGNSGGPLLNIRGEMIGVNNFIMTGSGFSRGNIGLGFAIASNLAKQVADDLAEQGEVIRPFIGINMQELSEDLKKQFDANEGVLVSQVLEGHPAQQAGVKAGDVVLRVGDKPVQSPHELLFAVLQYRPGDEIKLLIDRDGERKEVTITATRRDAKRDYAARRIGTRDELLSKLGIALEEADGGVLVGGVVGNSPAGAVDIRRGDRVLEVNQHEVATIADVLNALPESRDGIAVFYVQRRGSRFFVPIPMAGQRE